MKKKNSYIGISLIILLFSIYLFINLENRIDKNKLYNKEKTTNFFTFKKVPDFEFVNQYGKTITNKTYLGKVYVVEFFFTTCPTICPIMQQKMLTIQKEFSRNPNFGIASISITPKIDTPEVMKKYAEEHKITHVNWHLLTGKSEDVVYDLSNNGFKLYAGKGYKNHGGFEHSGLFALIDKNGNIVSRKDEFGNPIMYYRALEEQGFPDQIQELIADIKILLNEKPSTKRKV